MTTCGEPVAGAATVAGAMAFNTFVLFQFFNFLNSRSETRKLIDRTRNRHKETNQ